ncbi:MAG: SAM-dependent methyltransferase [Deltaproteobacteria bacterium]|nr:MAG: SAM-dependent methyltransferase [Deltaproteobacteria bacterium]
MGPRRGRQGKGRAWGYPTDLHPKPRGPRRPRWAGLEGRGRGPSMPSQPGPRLLSLADRVPAGRPMADIGTDHGLLPVWLLVRGRVPSAIGVDLRAAPLRAAARTAAAWGLAGDPRLSLRQGDGLAPLEVGEVDTVVIAGMGGRRIAALLEAAPRRRSALRRLVLQPNTEARALRAALQDLGWHLVDEDLCVEGGREFLTLVAEPGVGAPLTDAELLLGPVLLQRQAPAFRSWLVREHARLQAAAAAARAGTGRVPQPLAAALEIVAATLGVDAPSS